MNFSQQALDEVPLKGEQLQEILEGRDLDLMDLVHDAYRLRKKHFGRRVKVHILNNVQNGLCPEDCGYCGQAKTSDSNIDSYALKSNQEILDNAQKAKERGAFRYCMVLSGRGPSDRAIDHMCETIRTIKGEMNLKTCLSAGLMTNQQVKKLKEAGLDRLNHNLNSSENFYPKICTTHTWQDRQETLQSARQAGLELCSGYIFGMGESTQDRVDMIQTIAKLKPESIPINFLLPIKGNRLSTPQNLTPEICLRLLCAVRFASPASELRIAAGREYHLRSLQALALYPANSLFTEGYLLAKGQTSDKTLQMIREAGFEIESDEPLPELEESAGDFVGLKSQ